MKGVLFIVMPFCGVERPQIGVSTLKARLLSDGVPCDITYLNLTFADAVGYDVYSWMTNTYIAEVFAGEWMFACDLFPNNQEKISAYIDGILKKYGGFENDKIQRILRMKQFVSPFIDHCMRTINWDQYSIIGFTSTFEQNLPSLALAKRVKERFPGKIVMMGGGNCMDAMGVQLHESFPYLDFVFTGEADHDFPELVRRLGNGDTRRNDLRGYVRREGARSVPVEMGPIIHNLDALPYPNFDDYFRAFWTSSASKRVAPILQIETSRGCWWGAKHHCTFCGLNGAELVYRAKSPERVIDEILHLISRHGPLFVSPVDNIMPMQFFKTLLPELKHRKLGINLFYEMKANLKREQVKLLADAGVTVIQPGIESFSSNVLKLMRKGVSPLQNARLLRLCLEFGVDPHWNLLYGFPGENAKDYEDVLKCVKALSHLPPPEGCGAVRLDRFSPYFFDSSSFGIRNVRPSKPYRYLYPFEEEVLANLAYFFDYDFDGKEKEDQWIAPVFSEVEHWIQKHQQSRLEVVAESNETIVVCDTRPGRKWPEYRFHDPEKAIIQFCDEIRSIGQIRSELKKVNGGVDRPSYWLNSFLDYMVEHRLMLREKDLYLSLILPKPVRSPRTTRLQPERPQPLPAEITRIGSA